MFYDIDLIDIKRGFFVWKLTNES